MKITTVGIDLAKNFFQVHGVDEHCKVVLRKQLRRDQMAVFFANLPPCLIGMEACGSAHHWARKLQGMGHKVRLMAPPVRQAVCQDQQERCGRRRGNLRSRGTAQHEIRANQKCRATSRAGLAPGAPGLRQGSYCAG